MTNSKEKRGNGKDVPFLVNGHHILYYYIQLVRYGLVITNSAGKKKRENRYRGESKII